MQNIRRRIANKVRKVADLIQKNGRTIQSFRVDPWRECNGDITLRLDYPLDKESIVFDLGGYKGDWASEIFNKYNCYIYIFEPYQPYAKNIKNRYADNSKIKVFDFGLAEASKQMNLNISEDASSIFTSNGKNNSTIQLKEAKKFLENHSIDHINLMKINIEGGEYDLLEHLIATNLIDRIQNIQIQFHDFVPDATRRMVRIQDKLEFTHELTYQFEFVWENWKKK